MLFIYLLNKLIQKKGYSKFVGPWDPQPVGPRPPAPMSGPLSPSNHYVSSQKYMQDQNK